MAVLEKTGTDLFLNSKNKNRDRFIFANGAVSASFSYLFRSMASAANAKSGRAPSGSMNADELPQERIDRLTGEVYADYPGLPRGVKITAYPGVGIDGDIDTHGRWISQGEIVIAYEARRDNWIKSIIFHELLHVDEANYVAGGSRGWWLVHEYVLDGGHDSWTANAGLQYYNHQLVPRVYSKPNLQDAPWRR